MNNRFKVKNETLINIGLELEDSGGGGTAGAHPNEKLFFTDLMQGRTYGPGWLSPIFYNSLLDTGWYVPSEELLEEELIYLNSQLDPKILINESVLLEPPLKSFPLEYQCQSSALQACFHDYTWTGTCSLTSWNSNDIPPKDKERADWYNPDNKQDFVGTDQMLDYANLVLPWYSCRATGENGLERMKEYEEGYDPSNYGESFDNDSTCAMSTLQKGFTGSLISTSRCYKAWCGTDNKVRLVVGDEEVYCKRDGYLAKFTDYAGSVTCPPAGIVCANRKKRDVFGVSTIFPDRGPVDGKNLVAIVGNNYDMYNRSSLNITIGTVKCNVTIKRDNYILCQLEDVPKNKQDEILKNTNLLKKAIGNKENNKYTEFVAEYEIIGKGKQEPSREPDMYYFKKRGYYDEPKE